MLPSLMHDYPKSAKETEAWGWKAGKAENIPPLPSSYIPSHTEPTRLCASLASTCLGTGERILTNTKKKPNHRYLNADDDSNTLTLDPPPTRPQDAGTNSNSSTISKPPSVAVRTTWTLLLYLTGTAGGDDQCSGGETVFYPNDRVSRKEEIAVAPQTGLLLLHKHGNDCMLVSFTPDDLGDATILFAYFSRLTRGWHTARGKRSD